jgi:hypothetical protein
VFLGIEHGSSYADLVITQETSSIPVVYYITMKTQLSVVIFFMKSLQFNLTYGIADQFKKCFSVFGC